MKRFEFNIEGTHNEQGEGAHVLVDKLLVEVRSRLHDMGFKADTATMNYGGPAPVTELDPIGAVVEEPAIVEPEFADAPTPDFASPRAAEVWEERGRPTLPASGSGADGAYTVADVNKAAGA